MGTKEAGEVEVRHSQWVGPPQHNCHPAPQLGLLGRRVLGNQ
jgi:hypothetical protein